MEGESLLTSGRLMRSVTARACAPWRGARPYMQGLPFPTCLLHLDGNQSNSAWLVKKEYSNGNIGPFRSGTAAGQKTGVVEACLPATNAEGTAGGNSCADQIGSALDCRHQAVQGVARRPVLYSR